MRKQLDDTTPDFDWRVYRDLQLTPILSASLAALQEHGYHGTTVRDIARRVGLTMPSLYYHYGNKEGILSALLDIAMDDVLAHIEGGIAEAGDDTRAMMANFVTAVVMHNTRRIELAKLHPEFRFLGPEARAAYVAKRTKADNILVSVLDAGANEGIFQVDDLHFMARAILGMLNGIPDWYRAGGGLSPQEIAAKYVVCALRMAGDTSRSSRG